MKDSTHRLFSRLIEVLKLSDCFDIRKDGITCLLNGNEMIFRGCNALSDPKSEGAKGLDEVRICWVEEAHTVTDRDIEILLPSIRAKKSIFFWTYNSNKEPNPVSTYFARHSNAEFTSIHYWENPYLTDEQKEEARQLRRMNYQKYCEVWLGEPSTDTTRNVLILKWIDSAIKLYELEEAELLKNKEFKSNADGVFVYGLDVADEGKDSNSLAKRKGNALIDIWERATGDTTQTADWAVGMIFKNKGHLIFDRVGVGAGVKARLRQEYPEIETTPHSNSDAVVNPLKQWEFTKITNKDMFLNFGAQHWFYIRTMFENSFKKLNGKKFVGDYITINPKIKLLLKLKQQLLQIEFETNSKGQIHIIKAPEGCSSPNLADSFMISYRKPKKLAGLIS
jgi:phage terminase large subunit